MRTAFISGALGQDGAYLAELLIQQGYKVVGGSRRSSLDEYYRLRVLGIEKDVEIIPFDLTDPFNIFETISHGQFDEFYNLAAQSFVGVSWKIPLQTANVNAIGTLNILDAIKRTSQKTRFYQASTSEMFGLIKEPRQSETTSFHPRSPYGVAKLFAHSMTVNYRESFNLHASSGILFNHESPLRGREFVTKKITQCLAEIKLGLRTTLQVGNLDAKRDWGYAKEYVRGIWLMVQQDQPSDYVLATGKTTSVRDFINFSAEALGFNLTWDGDGVNEKGIDLKTGKIIVSVNKKYFRPAEVDILLGNSSKAKEILKWEATTSVEDLAHLMAEFDYNEIKKSF